MPPKFVCRVRCQIPLHELPRDLSWTCHRLPRDTPTNSTCRVRLIPQNFPEASRRQVVHFCLRGSFGEVRVMEFRHITRRVATSEARPPTRHEQVQWIKYSLHEKQRFVYMTFFELDLNTLLHISQANLLYLHTPYTMGS